MKCYNTLEFILPLTSSSSVANKSPFIMSIGTIPAEISQAKDLQEINLSNNQLSGAVYRMVIHWSR